MKLLPDADGDDVHTVGGEPEIRQQALPAVGGIGDNGGRPACQQCRPPAEGGGVGSPPATGVGGKIKRNDVVNGDDRRTWCEEWCLVIGGEVCCHPNLTQSAGQQGLVPVKGWPVREPMDPDVGGV